MTKHEFARKMSYIFYTYVDKDPDNPLDLYIWLDCLYESIEQIFIERSYNELYRN